MRNLTQILRSQLEEAYSLPKKVPLKAAIAEYEKHGFSAEELYVDFGIMQEYVAADVLLALGY